MGRGIALLFLDRGTRRGWVVSSTPRPTIPPGKSRYPFYRRLGGPQGRSGRAENLAPTGIRSRTVQPVVSRYTDWATRPTPTDVHFPNILSFKLTRQLTKHRKLSEKRNNSNATGWLPYRSNNKNILFVIFSFKFYAIVKCYCWIIRVGLCDGALHLHVLPAAEHDIVSV